MSTTRLQACARSGPTDYWGRLLSEGLSADEPRDQPILRAIRGANTGNLSLEELAAQLFDSEEFAGRFEHFGSGFDKRQLPALASALYALIRRQLGRNYRREGASGFFELWRLMGTSDAVRYDPAMEEWALGELLRCLPGQIHFANELYYFWLGGPHGSPERIRRVREAVMAKLKSSLEGHAEPSLCDCLNEDFPLQPLSPFLHLQLPGKGARHGAALRGRRLDLAAAQPIGRLPALPGAAPAAGYHPPPARGNPERRP